ncbi:MAG: trypsin-like peptidase domain-containing protein [Niabella sp.]
MKAKQILIVVLVSVLSTFAGIWVYGKFFKTQGQAMGGITADGELPANYASFFDSKGNAAEPTDFTNASETAIPAVVHIKTKIPARKITNNQNSRSRSSDPFEDFFGDFFGQGNIGPQIRPEQRASGSGVIISADGYIVTNNHVVSDGEDGVAPEIKITLNEGRKTYNAKVIGRDPNTDLAVLKIDATNLPYLVYGNSDNLRVGQWVLAVGYPFTLEATVTAGIVSAIGRSIGINSQQSASPVESFIQTDAAVNQGNSGGALINSKGELVGINSAILAPSGTYAGYSFAIPVTIVKKIVNDIVKYGDVKRGYLGVSYSPQAAQNDEYLKRAGLQSGQGVYVMQAPADGGAAKAGIKKGDIITKINDVSVASGIEMAGKISTQQPGDKVKITYIRNKKEYATNVTLSGTASKVDISSADVLQDNLGLKLQNVPAKDLAKYDFEGGVKVIDINADGPLGKNKMEKGFVITAVNGKIIKNMDELAKALSSSNSSVIELQGVYPGYSGLYRYQINLDGDDNSAF